GHGGTTRDIADVSFVSGNGENLAPGFENGAGSGGGDAEVLDAPGLNFGEMRPYGLNVAGNVNGHVSRLMRCQVEELDRAKLLDHDRIRPGRGGFEIEAIAVQSLADLLRPGVVGEEADGSIAVGEEINGVADPHRVVIVGIVAGNFGNARILQVGNPDGRGLAPVIALPRRLPLNVRHVGQVRAIRRKRSFSGDRNRELRGESTIDRYRVKLELEVAETVAPGGEQDFLAVGRPAHHVIVGRMEREPARNAAAGRNDEKVSVAIV